MNTVLIEFMLARQKQLEEIILGQQKELAQLPKGTLVLNSSRKEPQWFLQKKTKSGKYKRTYIGKDEQEQAVKLARRAYLTLLIKDEKNELECISDYLKRRQPKDLTKYLDRNSPHCKLLFNEDWEYEPYEKYQKYPEHLKHSTKKGDYVRSKSEALIANALFDLGIPYRYEWEREIGNELVAPDFTIMNPRTDSPIIWEHFGMMGDEGYYSDWQKKMFTYTHNGYLPGNNLITTYENLDNPLDAQEVNATILHYLL